LSEASQKDVFSNGGIFHCDQSKFLMAHLAGTKSCRRLFVRPVMANGPAFFPGPARSPLAGQGNQDYDRHSAR